MAENAGLSEVLVKKLEQGAHEGIRLSTLYALAEALGVPPGHLLDGARNEAEDDIVKEPDREMLIPVRDLFFPGALVEGSVDETELELAKLRRRVLSCTTDYDHARYTKLAAGIPSLIRMIDLAVDLNEDETKADVYRLLAHAYIITARLLIQLRDESLACVAVERAMDAAEKAGDPIMRASAVQDFTGAFMRQGRLDAAEAVAVNMAAEIGEPSITKATPAHMAVWGRLLTGASTAAAYNNRPETAKELLDFASGAAARIGAGPMDYGKYWAAFGPARIAVTRTHNALVGGDAPLALRLGANIRWSENLTRGTWSGHLLTMAGAQTATRDYAGAIGTMKTIRRLAPEWVKNHRVAHDVARRLLDATSVRRAKSSGLADLVAFMGVEP